MGELLRLAKMRGLNYSSDPLSLWSAVSVYCPQKGYFAAIFEDITKRKKTQEALEENEKRLNRSQEIAHLGSWELDLNSNRLIWSDEVYRIFWVIATNIRCYLRSLPKRCSSRR